MLDRDKAKQDIKNIPYSDLTEQEKEFYDSFEVEERNSENDYFSGNIGYPPITSKILIQLISVLNIFLSQGLGTCSLISGCTYDEVKDNILHLCCLPLKSMDDPEVQLFHSEVLKLFKK